MIGGYLYGVRDENFDMRLRSLLDPGCIRVEFCDNGCFFYSNPFGTKLKPFASSGDLAALTEDLLIAGADAAHYRSLDLDSDFLVKFRQQGPIVFNSIQNDFRMAVAFNRGAQPSLFLASNRAGSGRIYYHRLKKGIVFCSDLRFLLRIAPFEVNRLAIYAILKYGSIPEPLTIGEHVYAVPPAHYLHYRVADGAESLSPYFRYQFAGDAQPRQFEGIQSLESVKRVLQKTASFLSSHPVAMLLSGGIDSSLYGCYLSREKTAALQGFYCSFGREDPEYPYACAIAERLGLKLQVATMAKSDAMSALDDAVRFTDHPFADFSSLPIVFLLQYIRGHQSSGEPLIIECNGGDDCFGFPALAHKRKFLLKHLFPEKLKKAVARALAKSSCWKWESSEGSLSRVAALADVHEKTIFNYFLVQAPVNYLSLNKPKEWDDSLQEIIEQTSSRCGEDYSKLSYEAKTTIRQLLYINSSRWAAKALSVGESLGMRVVYPYIWYDVLREQEKLPWGAKIHKGIVKWPLKRLLEEYMPADFVYRKKSGFVPPFVQWLTDPDFNDKVRGILLNRKSFVLEIIPARILEELLSDAREGRRLRFPILNMLWGALFTESWIQQHRAVRQI